MIKIAEFVWILNDRFFYLVSKHGGKQFKWLR